MKHRTKDEAPTCGDTRARSVSESHDNGRETAPFLLATDTGYSVANAYDANGRGRGAVQGA